MDEADAPLRPLRPELNCPSVCALASRHGRVRWELGRPYLARKDEGGMCVHRDAHGCTIYSDRPGVCRRYSCASDQRIWIDFAGRIPNEEWIAQNTGPARARLRVVYLDPNMEPR